jgi:prepilin-type N-terminal cleavage/methylation domain-containing protein
MPSRPTCAGVTLVELLIVMTIVALLAGLSYPSAAAGLDSLRLRSVSDQVVSFLNTAIDRADRRQQVIEMRISPAEGALAARSADQSFVRTLALPETVRIAAVEPAVADAINANEPRRFLLYPGGTLPRIAIDLMSRDGRKRQVIVDPITGMPHAEAAQ